ncbi:MAG: NAD(P)H-hydrate dehydratase [Cyanobacteria bacterium REEB67]|nr:NAD(P)H-hydrate dehydratase [Cyanobacteria bacterium REEB67]
MLSNVRVPTTAQIRALEAAWIKSANSAADHGKGAPALNWGQVLMENAGRGAAFVALALWDEHAGQIGKISVVCGKGNNGGDGLVVARYLSIWGLPVTCFILANAPASAGESVMSSAESETNLRLLQKTQSEIIYLEDSEVYEDVLSAALDQSIVIVDAIFGTGLNRAIEGAARVAIEAINNSFKPVLAIDIASGINSDSGQVMGAAVRATRTVTFGYLKPGQLQHPGSSQSGDLHLVDIGLPDFDFLEKSDENAGAKPEQKPEQKEAHIYVTTCGAVQAVLPHRPNNSNKGTFGNLLTVAGSLGMSGSGIMCAHSALRTGAGLSYVATARSLIASLPAEELVYKPLSETTAQSISKEALKEVTTLLETVSAVVLGPGLSQNPDTVSFVLDLLDLIDKPCVLDADALNAISQNTASLGKPANNFVMTPHPKELSRLTGKSVAEISADRVGACLAAARSFDCVVVLKGAHTVVASPDGEVYINPTGNSGMSTAGAGDVLSGIIGGLMAQGLNPLNAAVAGVYLHGKAGDIAANTLGQAGLVAGDISAGVPVALTVVKAGELSHLEQLLSHSVTNL